MEKQVLFFALIGALCSLAVANVVPPQFAADNPCPYNYTGPIPNPEDCHTFYLCNAGVPYLMECPDNLCYNHGNEQCDRCDEVPGCGGTGNPPTGTPSTSTARPTNATSTTSRPTNATSTTSRPTRPTNSTSRPTTVPTSTVPSLLCPDISFIKMPYPGDCNRFYFCVDGSMEGVSRCEEGLWFHFTQQACIPPWDDTCS